MGAVRGTPPSSCKRFGVRLVGLPLVLPLILVLDEEGHDEHKFASLWLASPTTGKTGALLCLIMACFPDNGKSKEHNFASLWFTLVLVLVLVIAVVVLIIVVAANTSNNTSNGSNSGSSSSGRSSGSSSSYYYDNQ